MVRSLVLGAVLATGIATIANAGFAPNAIGNSDGSFIRVAEGCGPGWWRGPGGRCHPWRRAALVQGDITSGRKVRGAGQIETIEPPTSSHPSQQDPIRLGFLIGRPAGDVYCNP